MNRFLLTVIALFVFSVPSFASNSADILVVLDQSGSMKENLPVVKEYVKKSIFKKVAQKDDTVYIFAFDGTFYPVKSLKGNVPYAEIDKALATIDADGRFTDLTYAVESMRVFAQQNCDPKNKKIVFFLTDGINDPPSFSPYREGLQHRFFTEAKKEVDARGWKVFVTGIGEKTDAKNVAALVGADYVELSSKPTLSEFDQKLTSRLKAARSNFWPWFLSISLAVILMGAGGVYFVFFRR